MSRKTEVWQAPARALENMPETSGNTVNGLGEQRPRPPSPFFWHEPRHHDFGAMQGYTIGVMYGLEDAEPIRKAFSINENFRPGTESGKASNEQFIHRGPDPIEVASTRVRRSASAWSRAVKEFALAHHADVVGIAAMRPEWIYEGFEVREKYVIVVGVAHDYTEIAQAPSVPGNNRAIVEVGRQYTRAARSAAELSNYIRGQGYGTTSFPGPTAQDLLMIPAAIEAGLGELGKHGSLINRKFGASFRLAAVTTDMPLDTDRPDVFGGDEFCLRCQVCTDACPPDAIYRDKQWVRGDLKWYVDFDKCIPYFAETRGCAICIAVCPWSRPGVADKLVVKMAKLRASKHSSGHDPVLPPPARP
ncbi:MAG: 4Fe-4S dicluster domain-containing protein [Gammaproteobacteria bacterium]|nr:4Fe-4S dicluster domain-containing protein [Gammaproteobacteria bacterium]